MKLELLEFKRCFCCLPLRYGLLVTSYIRLILTLALLTSVTSSLYRSVLSYTPARSYILYDIGFQTLFTLIFLTELCVNIVFLIGGHRKNAKLLRIFYIHNIILFCIFTLGFTLAIVLDLIRISKMPKEKISFFLPITLSQATVGLPWIGCHIYYILLIRSEMLKLKNNCKFRFTNIAAESACAMENGTDDQHNGTDDQDNGTDDQDNGTDVQMNGTKHLSVALTKQADEQTKESTSGANETSLHFNGASNPDTNSIIKEKESSKETFNYQKL